MLLIPTWMIVFGLMIEANPGLALVFPTGDEFCSFPNVWKYAAWCASCFNVLMGVTVVIIVCNEIQFKTMKQNVIDGLSKRDVILGKFLVVFALSTVVSLYTALIAFIFGISYSGIENVYENSHIIFTYYLQTVGYFSVAFLVASVIQKPAISIVTFVLIFPIETIIGKNFMPDNMYNFFPLNILSRLTPFPFETIALALAEEETGKDIWIFPMWVILLASIFIISIIFYFCYRVLKRRDL